MIDVNGTLYGTTLRGGAYGRRGDGTVFSITTSGTEKVLHSFGKGSDGVDPEAGLIDVKGTLYGTTSEGWRARRWNRLRVDALGRPMPTCTRQSR